MLNFFLDRERSLARDWKNWSKKIFLEWFRSQGELFEKYAEKFDKMLEDDEPVDLKMGNLKFVL